MGILVGHDIDGRPLHIGDKGIVVADPEPPSFNGQVVTVLDRPDDDPGYVYVDYVPPGERPHWLVQAAAIRKFAEDHRPADASFDEIMQTLHRKGALT